MPKPTFPNHAKWVIADFPQVCTNTSCKAEIGVSILCVEHINGGGYACGTCGAKHFADVDDIERDLIAGGFKSMDKTKPRTITSFGYKMGAPKQDKGHLVVDVRKTVRNPWPIKSLRALDGRSEEIKTFIARCNKSNNIITNMLFQLRLGRDVFVGCFGGKHRSVAIAEMLAAKAEGEGLNVVVVHRDLKVKL